jgi:DNA-binding NtrC family response regulator
VLEYLYSGGLMPKPDLSSRIDGRTRSLAAGDNCLDAARTVLVVEDNELIRNIEADVLRGLGYDVIAVGDTDEALAFLGEPHIVLLITDIRLPGTLGGLALGRTAKQRRPDLKVVVVGVDVDQFTPEDLRGIADERLGKPFTVDEFEERVRSTLGQYK